MNRLVCLTVMLVLAAHAWTASAEPQSAAEIISLQGKGEFREAAEPRWHDASVRQHLAQGNFVRTGDVSRMAVLLTDQTQVRLAANSEDINEAEVTLPEPDEVHFVVGQMGIAFDPAADKMVLVIQELPAGMAEEEENAQSDEPKPSVARIWGSIAQMRTLSRQAKDLVAQGRPICPLCQRAMDPEGHFCPRGNGHGAKIQED